MLFIIHTGASVAPGFAAVQCIKVKTLKCFALSQHEIIISFSVIFSMILISSLSYIWPFNLGKYYDWPISPLNHQWLKIVILLGISILSASMGVEGMISTSCGVRKLLEAPRNKEDFEIYMDLKEELERYLMITGYILSSGIITVYFFSQSQKAMGVEELFDKYGVAIFGLLFSIFIAAIFIPSKMLLSEYGNKIWLSHVGTPPTYENDLKKWVKASDRFSKHLQLTSDALETFKLAVPILGPLLSTLIPFLFEHKG